MKKSDRKSGETLSDCHSLIDFLEKEEELRELLVLEEKKTKEKRRQTRQRQKRIGQCASKQSKLLELWEGLHEERISLEVAC
jgi:hypothetical protein